MKKVPSGKRKYLPASRAGLAIPCLVSKHQGARLALLKNIILLKRDNRTIPGWAIILEEALRMIRFNYLEGLLLSAGHADLQLAHKHLLALGFFSLAMLFENYILISNLLSCDDIGSKQHRKKRKRNRKTPLNHTKTHR